MYVNAFSLNRQKVMAGFNSLINTFNGWANISNGLGKQSNGLP